MKRKMMSPGSDRRYFRLTADRTRSINTSPYIARGGIRL